MCLIWLEMLPSGAVAYTTIIRTRRTMGASALKVVWNAVCAAAHGAMG